MSYAGYGLEKRYLKPFPHELVRTSTGVPVFKSVSNYEEQDTVSFRDPQRGSIVQDSAIDPWAYLLQRGARLQVERNSTKLTTPVIVGSRTVAFAPHRDNGHAFRSQKRTFASTVRSGYHYGASGIQYYYSGPYMTYGCIIASGHRSRMPFVFEGGGSTSPYRFGKIPKFTQSDLVDFGKKAIVTLAPGYPDFSTFTALGELFVGIPQLIGHSVPDLVKGIYTSRGLGAQVTRAASREFLNYIFGVLPTVEDAAKIVEGFNDLSNRLQFLERNSGRGIRRNMTFSTVDVAQTFTGSELEDHGAGSGGYYGPHGYAASSTSSTAGMVDSTSVTSSLYMKETRKVSFKGSFSRFIPVDYRLTADQNRFMTAWSQMGANPSLSRVWQLIPFSWLVDWFLSIRRSLALVDRVLDDSLVINYGYVVGMTSRSAVCKSSLTFAPARTASFSNVSSMYASITKERVRANPYGFISPSSLSLDPTKVAILAALGIILGKVGVR